MKAEGSLSGRQDKYGGLINQSQAKHISPTHMLDIKRLSPVRSEFRKANMKICACIRLFRFSVLNTHTHWRVAYASGVGKYVFSLLNPLHKCARHLKTLWKPGKMVEQRARARFWLWLLDARCGDDSEKAPTMGSMLTSHLVAPQKRLL